MRLPLQGHGELYVCCKQLKSLAAHYAHCVHESWVAGWSLRSRVLAGFAGNGYGGR